MAKRGVKTVKTMLGPVKVPTRGVTGPAAGRMPKPGTAIGPRLMTLGGSKSQRGI